MANKRYGGVAWAKGIDLGKELEKSTEDLIATARAMSGVASNIHYRAEKAGVNSVAKGMLERSLISIHGKVSFKPPEGKVYKTYNNEAYGVKVQRSISERQRLKNYITALYTYINASGSTIKGSREELQKARDNLGWQEMTFEDLKDFWEIFDSQRSEISEKENYKPYQEQIVEWMTEPDPITGEYYTKEEIKQLLKNKLKNDKPSNIPKGALKKSGKKMRG